MSHTLIKKCGSRVLILILSTRLRVHRLTAEMKNRFQSKIQDDLGLFIEIQYY